ncbi:hypothetical protein Pcinc_003255 [Petrolisthes cinctipes]|uniref:Ubiquitin carboxyl-terminal hydrolase n=1 Tax=Petrolisthes cinctipes TaxID=88211 RepID=A0AAE1L4V0_PETCI|nr:hypothetical protein Pcinc_003255 [Petrolisthes cinctipes]
MDTHSGKDAGDNGEKEVTGSEDEPLPMEPEPPTAGKGVEAKETPDTASTTTTTITTQLQDLSITGGGGGNSNSNSTLDAGSVCPTVPSSSSPQQQQQQQDLQNMTTTSHAEEPQRNSMTDVEENSGDNNKQQQQQKCSSSGLPDLLSDSSLSEPKTSDAATTPSMAGGDTKKNTSMSSDGERPVGIGVGSEENVGDIDDDDDDDDDDNNTRDKECSGGVCGWMSQGDSVLPSMGILPEADKTLPPPPPQASQPQRSSPPSSTDSSRTAEPLHAADPSEVVHKIKKIKWQDIEVPIITQNNNGPCPLLAIVNVMILKGQITLPSDRSEITGGDLVLVVGNALFDQPRNSLPVEMRRHVEQNTEDAISILHKLLTGLDVNVKFSGVRDFEFTGELCIFDLLGIMLYHGWVVDPSSEAAPIITSLSYNQLTNNIFAWKEEAIRNNNNDLLMKAMLCEDFINSSRSQLTIHGLFELGSALERDEIAVLFRNNHFSTIYKRGDQLYQLLTDQGFLHENMVWETLNDVDASFSEFVNGSFETIPPAPDPSTSSSASSQNMTLQQQISSDQELAAMLQREVDQQQQQQQNFERLKDTLGLHNLSDEEMAKKLQEEENRLAAEASAEAQASRQQQQQHQQQQQDEDDDEEEEGGGVPSSTSTNVPTPPNSSQHPHSTQHPHEERKKKDCVIL